MVRGFRRWLVFCGASARLNASGTFTGIATSIHSYADNQEHRSTTNVTNINSMGFVDYLVLPGGLTGLTGDFLLGSSLRVYTTFNWQGPLAETSPSVSVYPDKNFTSTVPSRQFSGGAYSAIKAEIYQANTSAPINVVSRACPTRDRSGHLYRS